VTDRGGQEGPDAQLERLAALGDPARRALYRYVAAHDGPVSREQAAGGVGVARHAAKFHLDRLVAHGLLDVEYARPPGRGGPGAGRPAKLYRRAGQDLAVSLPERRYDLIARVLAEGVEAATDDAPLAGALEDAARAAGRAAVDAARSEHEVGVRTPLHVVASILARHGYEPRVEGSVVTLANCPFQGLARSHPDLVCGLNIHLVEGLIEALDEDTLQTRLDPAPGRCCATVSEVA
jgi:predicted ArsR family transcriptional regulator